MNFRKAYNEFLAEALAPLAKEVATGDKIYEWSYLNDNGDIVTDKRNMYEYIQSFKRITDYKEVIDENGNIDPIFAGNNAGVYSDISAIPDDYSGLNSYIANLVEILRADIAKEQAKKTASAIKESAETAGQASQASAEKEGGNK